MRVRPAALLVAAAATALVACDNAPTGPGALSEASGSYALTSVNGSALPAASTSDPAAPIVQSGTLVLRADQPLWKQTMTVVTPDSVAVTSVTSGTWYGQNGVVTLVTADGGEVHAAFTGGNTLTLETGARVFVK